MRSSVIILISVFLAAVSCKPKSSVAVEINKNGVPVVYFEQITETGELKLSDIAKDFEIVRLETNQNCMIDYAMRSYVSEDYIIISTVRQGIYLFSREGKYIRHIAETGNGPGEVSDPNRNLEYSESDNSLYATESFGYPSEVFRFNIEDKSFKKIELPLLGEAAMYSIRDILRENDSTLLISTILYPNDSLSCRVIAINPEGELLWQINHSNIYDSYNVELYKIKNKKYFCYTMAGDTLFSLEDTSITPFAIFKSDREQYSFNRESNIGDISYSYRVLNEELIIGSYNTVIDFDDSRPGRKRPVYDAGQKFVFNYKKNRTYLLEKYQDDFLGSDRMFSRPQKNGLYSIPFNAQDILKLDEKLQADPEADPGIRDRVHKLVQEIDINDNPILLIAKMK